MQGLNAKAAGGCLLESEHDPNVEGAQPPPNLVLTSGPVGDPSKALQGLEGLHIRFSLREAEFS